MSATAIMGATFFGVALACAVAWNVLYPRLLAQLRTRHVETWQELGCPKYIDFRPGRTTAVMRFLFKRDYLALSDEPLGVLATRARSVLIGGYVGLGVFVLLMSIETWGAR